MATMDRSRLGNKFLKTRSNERSSRPEVFCKKGILRNFTKFTGKHQCQSLFLIKLEAAILMAASEMRTNGHVTHKGTTV